MDCAGRSRSSDGADDICHRVHRVRAEQDGARGRGDLRGVDSRRDRGARWCARGDCPAAWCGRVRTVLRSDVQPVGNGRRIRETALADRRPYRAAADIRRGTDRRLCRIQRFLRDRCDVVQPRSGAGGCDIPR